MWVSPCATKGSFLIAPGHRWDLNTAKLHCCFLKCLTKMGSYQKRLLNSVLAADLLSETIKKEIKKERKEVILFQVLKFYNVVKELIF